MDLFWNIAWGSLPVLYVGLIAYRIFVRGPRVERERIVLNGLLDGRKRTEQQIIAFVVDWHEMEAGKKRMRPKHAWPARPVLRRLEGKNAVRRIRRNGRDVYRLGPAGKLVHAQSFDL